jgi:hypothetical protein
MKWKINLMVDFLNLYEDTGELVKKPNWLDDLCHNILLNLPDSDREDFFRKCSLKTPLYPADVKNNFISYIIQENIDLLHNHNHKIMRKHYVISMLYKLLELYSLKLHPSPQYAVLYAILKDSNDVAEIVKYSAMHAANSTTSIKDTDKWFSVKESAYKRYATQLISFLYDKNGDRDECI